LTEVLQISKMLYLSVVQYHKILLLLSKDFLLSKTTTIVLTFVPSPQKA
jgi:hypothetical protein